MRKANLEELQYADRRINEALRLLASSPPGTGSNEGKHSLDVTATVLRECLDELSAKRSDYRTLFNVNEESVVRMLQGNAPISSYTGALSHFRLWLKNEIGWHDADQALKNLLERRQSGVTYVSMVSSSLATFEAIYLSATGRNDASDIREIRTHIDALAAALLRKDAEIVALRSIVAELRATIAGINPQRTPKGEGFRRDFATGVAQNFGVMVSNGVATTAMVMFLGIPAVEGLIRELIGTQPADKVQLCLVEHAAEVAAHWET